MRSCPWASRDGGGDRAVETSVRRTRDAPACAPRAPRDMWRLTPRRQKFHEESNWYRPNVGVDGPLTRASLSVPLCFGSALTAPGSGFFWRQRASTRAPTVSWSLGVLAVGDDGAVFVVMVGAFELSIVGVESEQVGPSAGSILDFACHEHAAFGAVVGRTQGWGSRTRRVRLGEYCCSWARHSPARRIQGFGGHGTPRTGTRSR